MTRQETLDVFHRTKDKCLAVIIQTYKVKTNRLLDFTHSQIIVITFYLQCAGTAANNSNSGQCRENQRTESCVRSLLTVEPVHRFELIFSTIIRALGKPWDNDAACSMCTRVCRLGLEF